MSEECDTDLDFRERDPLVGILDEHFVDEVTQLRTDVAALGEGERLRPDLVVQRQDVVVVERDLAHHQTVQRHAQRPDVGGLERNQEERNLNQARFRGFETFFLSRAENMP